MADYTEYQLAYTGAEIATILENASTLPEDLAGKVDAVEGKGLSSNDYTNEDKEKLSNIESGAQKNIQSDWNQNDNTKTDFIKNKPSIPSKTSELTNDSGFITSAALSNKVDKVAGKGLSTNDYTTAEKTKLAELSQGASITEQQLAGKVDKSDLITKKGTGAKSVLINGYGNATAKGSTTENSYQISANTRVNLIGTESENTIIFTLGVTYPSSKLPTVWFTHSTDSGSTAVVGIYKTAEDSFKVSYNDTEVTVSASLTSDKIILNTNGLSSAIKTYLLECKLYEYELLEENINKAEGIASHSEGYSTEAKNDYEHSEGIYNKSTKTSSSYGDAGNTQHSIGIGTASSRKNAMEIMQNGDMYLFGIGGYDGTNSTSSNAKNVKQILDTKVNAVTGKGLSSNDFTDDYKTKVDTVMSMSYEDAYNILNNVNA